MTDLHAPELTRNQALVHDTLCQADGPLGAYALLDRLRDRGFRAPLQVYRALDRLQTLGLVHRVESLNAFVACAHTDDIPHDVMGFAICDDCGCVAEFADAAAVRTLHRWAREQGFRVDSATIELKGCCRACRS